MEKKRAPIIIGNWKMYKTAHEAEQFISMLKKGIEALPTRVMLAVPFTAIGAAVEASKKSKILIGAQNMHDAEEGAFTGEISCRMLQEAGAQFVLLGHSERRHIFGESNAFIQRKVKRGLTSGVTPVLCVGEQEEERVKGKTAEILNAQLQSALTGLAPAEIEKMLFAYEPVWAIGTGKTATPDIANEAHQICKDFVEKHFKVKPSILYGGSVKPENISALLKMPNIAGALVGGASLDPSLFLQLIKGSIT
ncbi:MAG: triose-phosphate isomerase [Chlamydiales bacterium]